MSNLNLKGLWIPIEVLTDKTMTPSGTFLVTIRTVLISTNGRQALKHK